MSKEITEILALSLPDRVKAYEQAVKEKDVFTACSYFNELKYKDLHKLYTKQLSIYSSTDQVDSEIQLLLSILTLENFYDFDIQYLISRLVTYFSVCFGIDTASYYADLLSKKYKNAQISVISKSSPIQKSKLKVLTDESAPNLTQAIKAIERKNIEEAREYMGKIKKGDREYLLSRNMLSVFLMAEGKLEESKNSALKILQEYPNNAEAIVTLYQITKLNNDRNQEIKEAVCNAKNVQNIFQVYIIQAYFFMRFGEYRSALQVLMQVDEQNRFNLSYLEKIYQCQLMLGDRDSAIVTLKKVVALNVKDFYARYLLKLLCYDKDLSEKQILRNISQQDIDDVLSEIKQLLALPLEQFARTDLMEVIYYFYWLVYMKNKPLMGKFVENMLCAKYTTNFVFDVLLQVNVDYQTKCDIIAKIVEMGVSRPIYLLNKCLLKKYEIDFPKEIFNEFNIGNNCIESNDTINFAKLAKAYGIAVGSLMYKNKYNSNISKSASILFEKMKKMVNDELILLNNEKFIAATMLMLSDESFDEQDKNPYFGCVRSELSRIRAILDSI